MVEPYELPEGAHAWHFDFYRFGDPHEWEDAGLREMYAAPGLKLAEWPENAADVLPRADWQMTLEVLADERRQVSVQALTPHGRQLLAQMT